MTWSRSKIFHSVNTEGESYTVEELMISGFETFQTLELQNYIRIKFESYENEVTVTTVSKINTELIRPKRAGVVVWTWWDNVKYFGFGSDWSTGELTDFGGMIKYSKKKYHKYDNNNKYDVNVIAGALREYREETLNIFGKVHKSTLDSSLVLFNRNMLIIFLYLEVDPAYSYEYFHYQLSKMDRHEIRDLKWISEDILMQKVGDNKPSFDCPLRMYDKVRDLLFYAGNFYNKL